MPTASASLNRLIKVVFGGLAVFMIVLVTGTSLLYHHFAKDLPKFDSIDNYHPALVSEVFADDGTQIGQFWQECRYLVAYEEIPRRVINAFVASEDERFWEHKGVDFKSILRAFIQNLRAGHVVQGGSTISQQVTRALLLSREKRFGRKIKEAILATQLEQSLSKEKILYLYLNEIYLGNRSYGVEAAARNYFHKTLKELNLAEISIIAGLPSAPSTYAPTGNPEPARQRQVRVLERMLTNGYITKKEMEEAIATPLTLYRMGTDKDMNLQTAPYFVEHIRRLIEEKYGQETLYHGGLKIFTTVSRSASQAAEKAVRKGLFRLEKMKGFRGPIAKVPPEKIDAFAQQIHKEISEFEEPIILNFLKTPPRPKTTLLKPDHIYKGVIKDVDAKGLATIAVGYTEGSIAPADRAWTGRTPKIGDVYWVRKKEDKGDSPKSFTIEQYPRLESALFSFNPLTGEVKAMVGGFNFKESEFNRATQALRQPGSAFKPIIYAAALDKGYTPKTVILDAPVTYQVGQDEVWTPKNYGNKSYGPMTLRSALTNSVNVIAVKIFHDIGIDYTIAYARKLGLVSPIHKYLSSALGASDISLQELVHAYGTFPAGGVRPDLIFIKKIIDKQGHVIEENHPASLDPEHVFDMPKIAETQKAKEEILFNQPLKEAEEKHIKDDSLRLSPAEMKTLYGTAIPPDHAITPKTAFLMVNLMRDVVEHGTGYKAKELNRPAAGKTGTTNDESDAWFIAYVPDLIAGVWIGYDNRKPIGDKMTGGVIAAPIWLDYMQDVLKDSPVKDFQVPSYIKLSEIDSMKGGSTGTDSKPAQTEQEIPGAPPPASRSVDFLYKDL